MKDSENEQLPQRGDLQQIHGANLDVVNEESASPEIKRLYQQFREDFTRSQVPGILQCFATHPPLLTHMMGLAKSMLFVDGALGRQHKEMISTFVSATNKCNYCADSHACSFRVLGGSASARCAVLSCDPDSHSITANERTLLQFGRKITQESHAITPDDIEAMRLANWTDLQIAEAIHVTALFATFNRVVNAFGLPSQELLKLFEHTAAESGTR
jgi:uncharacterized peroxidase-related enzyme